MEELAYGYNEDTTRITQPTEIQILGVRIQIIDDPDLVNLDGAFYPYKHEIHMKPAEYMLERTSKEYEKAIRYNEVLRHELIHAFFCIAGLEAYSDDETLVDWIASMYPRMTSVFKKAGCDA